MAYYLVRAKPKRDRLGELEKLLRQNAFVGLRNDFSPFLQKSFIQKLYLVLGQSPARSLAVLYSSV